MMVGESYLCVCSLEYKKGEDWDHTRWYLTEQASMAEARAEKKARKGNNHTFGWEVFNEVGLRSSDGPVLNLVRSTSGFSLSSS